jgi:hypothetical protein
MVGTKARSYTQDRVGLVTTDTELALMFVILLDHDKYIKKI